MNFLRNKIIHFTLIKKLIQYFPMIIVFAVNITNWDINECMPGGGNNSGNEKSLILKGKERVSANTSNFHLRDDQISFKAEIVQIYEQQAELKRLMDFDQKNCKNLNKVLTIAGMQHQREAEEIVSKLPEYNGTKIVSAAHDIKKFPITESNTTVISNNNNDIMPQYLPEERGRPVTIEYVENAPEDVVRRGRQLEEAKRLRDEHHAHLVIKNAEIVNLMLRNDQHSINELETTKKKCEEIQKDIDEINVEIEKSEASIQHYLNKGLEVLYDSALYIFKNKIGASLCGIGVAIAAYLICNENGWSIVSYIRGIIKPSNMAPALSPLIIPVVNTLFTKSAEKTTTKIPGKLIKSVAKNPNAFLSNVLEFPRIPGGLWSELSKMFFKKKG